MSSFSSARFPLSGRVTAAAAPSASPFLTAQPVFTAQPIQPVFPFPGRPPLTTFPPFTPFPTFPPVLPPILPPQPPPPPPVSTPTELMTVLTAVPVAQDGDVITAEYHNALREALLSIASQMGVSLAARDVTVSVPPSFLPIAAEPSWRLHAGFAANFVAEEETATVRGWVPLDLPDATRIQSITVSGTRSGVVESLAVRLIRITISDEGQAQTVLATLQLKELESPFRRSAEVSISGASPALVDEHKVVDNTRYKYLALAELTNAAANVRVQLNSLLVSCRR